MTFELIPLHIPEDAYAVRDAESGAFVGRLTRRRGVSGPRWCASPPSWAAYHDGKYIGRFALATRAVERILAVAAARRVLLDAGRDAQHGRVIR